MLLPVVAKTMTHCNVRGGKLLLLNYFTGTCEATAFIENIMDNIARTTKKDPVSIRLKNMTKDNNVLPEMWNVLKESASYEQRRKDVEEFNKVLYIPITLFRM